MASFVLDVTSSLVATFLTVAGGWAVSKRLRRWVKGQCSRFAGLPVQQVYRRQELASDDLANDVAEARWIRVLAGRGNELTRDAFKPVWTGATQTRQVVQVLLPDLRPLPNSWLARREADLLRLDPGFSPGLLTEQVRTNATYVATAARRQGNISLRFYNSPNVYRAIVTDKVAYLTLYGDSAHGRHSPCIAARRPGLIYQLALSLFTTTWEQSEGGQGGGELAGP